MKAPQTLLNSPPVTRQMRPKLDPKWKTGAVESRFLPDLSTILGTSGRPAKKISCEKNARFVDR